MNTVTPYIESAAKFATDQIANTENFVVKVKPDFPLIYKVTTIALAAIAAYQMPVAGLITFTAFAVIAFADRSGENGEALTKKINKLFYSLDFQFSSLIGALTFSLVAPVGAVILLNAYSGFTIASNINHELKAMQK